MSLLGTCDYFYHYVPLASGYSPPCDPTGINIALFSSAYSPPTASVDLVWMWAPDTSTPYSEASFFTHFNWSPSSTTSTPTSGTYAGYNHHQNQLTFAGTGLISDIMGYYACTFVHRGASTTPEFDLSPAILLNTTAGAPCPTYDGFSFAEYFTPDICAESAQWATTTHSEAPTTFAGTTTTVETTQTTTFAIQTTVAITTFATTISVVAGSENDEKPSCCGLVTYLYIASAVIASTVVGVVAFIVRRTIKFMMIRKLRKIHVG